MGSDFAGSTARHYRHYRRDVCEAVIDELIARADWSPSDTVVDLGCGTGQVAVPLGSRVGSVLACDIEPDQLTELRARLRELRVDNVVPCLAGDRELETVEAICTGHRPAGLVVANALHWMDESALVETTRRLLRPRGTLAVITHGPPLWLGESVWQQRVRGLLEEHLGRLSSDCGANEATLRRRAQRLRRAGFTTSLIRHETDYPVDAEWVFGHLLTALPSEKLSAAQIARLRDGVARVVPPDGALEHIVTTALLAT